MTELERSLTTIGIRSKAKRSDVEALAAGLNGAFLADANQKLRDEARRMAANFAKLPEVLGRMD